MRACREGSACVEGHKLHEEACWLSICAAVLGTLPGVHAVILLLVTAQSICLSRIRRLCGCCLLFVSTKVS